MKKLLFLLVILIAAKCLTAQETKWTAYNCITYDYQGTSLIEKTNLDCSYLIIMNDKVITLYIPNKRKFYITEWLSFKEKEGYKNFTANGINEEGIDIYVTLFIPTSLVVPLVLTVGYPNNNFAFTLTANHIK